MQACVFAGIFLGLLFVGSALTKGQHAADVRFDMRRNARGERIFSTYVTTPWKDIEDLLYLGPRLFLATFGLLNTAYKQLSLDTRACAKIICVLLSRNSRFSFEEVEMKTGIGHSLGVFAQLHNIEGVVFLPSHPAGISLTSDLRSELFRLFPIVEEATQEDRSENQQKSEADSATVDDQKSPYFLLGVTEKATLQEIKSAYRKKIKECHPDKFNVFGDEWRRMAEERAKLLNAAYESVMAGRSGMN
ncbi:J domain-containing protein [Pedosphaera parvula]|nr:J domain-containing protein [Pedosphaera parvula]